ncbi:hypothetical protein ABZU86_18360 [Streptomyces sp. NPDC005271]|uniref:SecDF P1 head subdomain-containing protein n=1 Tax=unclassified Streptomyces TaxID=2593676 RepID=UPI0033A84467
MRATWGRIAATAGVALAATAVAGCGTEGADGDYGGKGDLGTQPTLAPPVSVSADPYAARDARPLRLLPVADQTPGSCRDGAADAYQDQPSRSCLTVSPGTGITVRPTSAWAGYDKSFGGYAVTVGLDRADGVRLDQLTRELAAQQYPRNRLAMVREGTLLSAPSITTAISGGKIRITGNFDRETARQLAQDVRGR